MTRAVRQALVVDTVFKIQYTRLSWAWREIRSCHLDFILSETRKIDYSTLYYRFTGDFFVNFTFTGKYPNARLVVVSSWIQADKSTQKGFNGLAVKRNLWRMFQ